MTVRPRFALIGAAGYIAHRHIAAIRDVGGELVAAMDVSDSVGQLDAAFPHARFFTEFELFNSFLHTCRRQGRPIHYVSVCSPNYLHRGHVEAALRSGADVICEKPLVLTPQDVDELIEIESETGRRVFTILQLRLNSSNIALRDDVLATSGGKPLVDLTYVTSRGHWYYRSWKGDEARSGGIATNIGVHFFDLLGFLFGRLERSIVHHRAIDCAAGYLDFERASVRWYLSINSRDLPNSPDDREACRKLAIGNRVCNLSGDFRELHTACYREALAGRRVPLEEVRRAIALVAEIRSAPINRDAASPHPFLATLAPEHRRSRDGLPV